MTATASSFIYHGDRELIGQRGRRVYALAAEGRDIPRAGAMLFKRLRLAVFALVMADGRVPKSAWKPGETLDALIGRVPLPSTPGVHFTVLGCSGGHAWLGRYGRPLGDEATVPRVVPGPARRS